MNYIVLDMEWNQPFNKKNMIRNPVRLYGEIVQIGAVKLDESFHVLDTFKIMVTPKYYTKMHGKVTRLTRITTAEIQYGFPFPVAYRHFRKWCGEDFAFLTWGPDDIFVLRDNMLLHKLSLEWIPKAYNVQVVFDDQITKEGRQVSLSYAMEKIGEAALEAHDALNDAINTAHICQHLDMAKGLAEYEALKERIERGGSIKERSPATKAYAAREEALSDPKLTGFFCPCCGARIECSDFSRQSLNTYIGIAECENGDEMFVRIKLTKWRDGAFSAARIICQMDEDNREAYRGRKQNAEENGDEYFQSLTAAG